MFISPFLFVLLHIFLFPCFFNYSVLHHVEMVHKHVLCYVVSTVILYITTNVMILKNRTKVKHVINHLVLKLWHMTHHPLRGQVAPTGAYQLGHSVQLRADWVIVHAPCNVRITERLRQSVKTIRNQSR